MSDLIKVFKLRRRGIAAEKAQQTQEKTEDGYAKGQFFQEDTSGT